MAGTGVPDKSRALSRQATLHSRRFLDSAGPGARGFRVEGGDGSIVRVQAVMIGKFAEKIVIAESTNWARFAISGS